MTIGSIGLYQWYNKQPETKVYKEGLKTNREIIAREKVNRAKQQAIFLQDREKERSVQEVKSKGKRNPKIKTDPELQNLTKALLKANIEHNPELTDHYSKLVANRISELQNE